MEHLDQKKKISIMLAIMAAMLFAALNQTIVGTALPKIVGELGGFEYYSWVFTSFMLASSVTAILVGKLSDTYGRKPFILIGIGIFIVGSFLCGLSENIIELIIYRGVQGFGGGMIMSTAFTAVGDLFSPRERGRWQGIMSGVFGLASVFGPTLGGYIVDHTHWKWVFWVFLPVGIIAFAMIFWLFPSIKRTEKVPIDYLGSLFLTLTIVPLLLAFSWAGSRYDWASTEILGLFCAAAVALILFIVAERKAKSPVVPLSLFKNGIFTISNAVGLILGAGMFGAIMYMPFFVQGVMGTSATQSGFIMMPMTLAMVLASTIGGQLITKTGKYKLIALTGLLTMAVGMYLLSLMTAATSVPVAVLFIIIVGFGLGLAFPVFTLTVQNAVDQKLLGVATASTQLFRQLGGTIGVAILGTIMNARMNSKIGELMEQNQGALPTDPEVLETLEFLQDPQVLMDHQKVDEFLLSIPQELQLIVQDMLNLMKDALSFSLTGVFFIGSIIMLSAFILTFLLKEIPLRTSNQAPAKDEASQGTE
ncbi:MDR family MFS transporter [Bacillus horti]|uniref:EmrB/QacA subfamily drug resistance transporter n=1 Tax=Caldalkalibacillus horti TaxID=77523 RepID=A0ABT9VXZ2_9BACI|nr:MDR family MFS transporter [Bacillus horti]MDQ0165866.1 EmrB/QacA subfamily drug resistance transporter [Bacillus horti]